MKVLHIANDYCHTVVHKNLFMTLDQLGLEQVVFNPVRDRSDIGRNFFESNRTKIVYAHVVKSWYRFVYYLKRRIVFRELIKKIDCSQIDVCHASTLLTDGGLAYLLNKKFQIPYVVAVRNTDVNGFMDKAPHTWSTARRILLNAKYIFFISEGLKKKFENHKAVRRIIPRIQDRFISIPNGVEDIFLDNIATSINESHNIIYIGDFSDNKNVVRLIKAVLKLKEEPGLEDVKLSIVGGGNTNGTVTEQIISENPDTVSYLGKIYDKYELISQLRQHSVFAMPSIHETFGLVYIEALTQNLACLCTKGQGIDGLFDKGVGIAVDPLSVDDIKNALREMLLNRKSFGNHHVDFRQFRWNYIADKYCKYYSNSITK